MFVTELPDEAILDFYAKYGDNEDIRFIYVGGYAYFEETISSRLLGYASVIGDIPKDPDLVLIYEPMSDTYFVPIRKGVLKHGTWASVYQLFSNSFSRIASDIFDDRDYENLQDKTLAVRIVDIEGDFYVELTSDQG